MIMDEIAYKIMKTKYYGKMVIWLPKILLGLVVMWPKAKVSLMRRFIVTSGSIFIISFTAIGLLNTLNFTFESINHNLIGSLLIMSCFQGVSKIILMSIKFKDIADIIDNISLKFWPDDLTGYVEVDEEIKKFYIFTMSTCLVFLGTVAVFFSIFFITPLLIEERILPFNVEYSFDWKVSPNYELIYLSQVFYVHILALYVIGTDFFYLCTVVSVIIQFKILQQCLSLLNSNEMVEIMNKLDINNIIKSDKMDDLCKEYLKKCVKHHLLLLRFIKKLNAVFNLIILTEWSTVMLSMCLLIYMLVQNYAVNTFFETALALSMVIAYLQQLAFYCIVGSIFNYQINLLPEHLFGSKWIVINNEIKKDLTFVLQHSQQNLTLNVYNIYELNMVSYLQVLKLAFSVYTLFSNVSN
ncbi:unnamed protein product [Phyllotreta striolata]|uniref:Odorant receptor n=1 Tax=Phyllotreta striolata TaxID=444603 RepID=A0A9P0GW34_PHYSR|nr:unnamed protein product [Phyllotreta striolata]